MVSTVATYTNSYALSKVGSRGYSHAYTNRQGVWHETSDSKIDTSKHYWSTKTIYHSLWAKTILSRDRYKAFLDVVDPANETPGYKLRKVEEFIGSFKERCKLLYQLSQKLASMVVNFYCCVMYSGVECLVCCYSECIYHTRQAEKSA